MRIAGVALGVVLAGYASAQVFIVSNTAVVNYVEGTVYLDDKPLQPKPDEFPDIKEQQVLRTGPGMAEVLMTPGIFVRLGENSAIRIVSAKLTDTRVEVLRGSVLVDCDNLDRDNAVMLLYRGNSMLIRKHGLYRVDADPGLFKVYSGQANVYNERANAHSGWGWLEMHHRGKQTSLNGVLKATSFDVGEQDALTRWRSQRSRKLAKVGCAVYPGFGYGRIYHNTFLPCRTFLTHPSGYRAWNSHPAKPSIYVSSHNPGEGKHPPHKPSPPKPTPPKPPSRSGSSGATASAGHGRSSGGSSHAGGGASSGGSSASSGGHSSGGRGGGHR